MDLAYFIWTEPQAMVVPRPGEEPRLFAFIRPFQPLVIICFVDILKKYQTLTFCFLIVLTNGFVLFKGVAVDLNFQLLYSLLDESTFQSVFETIYKECKLRYSQERDPPEMGKSVFHIRSQHFDKSR